MVDQCPVDRGPDREPYVGPRYAGDNMDFSSSGNGNDNNDPWKNEDVPSKSDWKPDKNYWKEFHPDYDKKKKKNGEICEIPEENKGGYEDLLIDLLPQGHRYDIKGSSARAELEMIVKDPKALNLLRNGLNRIRDGSLTSIQQKQLKGFKHLKEYKFGRRGVRVIVNPGKNGKPDVIVGIVRRDRSESFIKSLRNKFETTNPNK